MLNLVLIIYLFILLSQPSYAESPEVTNSTRAGFNVFDNNGHVSTARQLDLQTRLRFHRHQYPTLMEARYGLYAAGTADHQLSAQFMQQAFYKRHVLEAGFSSAYAGYKNSELAPIAIRDGSDFTRSIANSLSWNFLFTPRLSQNIKLNRTVRKGAGEGLYRSISYSLAYGLTKKMKSALETSYLEFENINRSSARQIGAGINYTHSRNLQSYYGYGVVVNEPSSTKRNTASAGATYRFGSRLFGLQLAQKATVPELRADIEFEKFLDISYSENFLSQQQLLFSMRVTREGSFEGEDYEWELKILKLKYSKVLPNLLANASSAVDFLLRREHLEFKDSLINDQRRYSYSVGFTATF